MPDTPDYSRYNPGSVRASLQDYGELAVRLGSPVYYDRRGEVIYYDTFSKGIGSWTAVLGGAGSSVKLTPLSVSNSGYAATLIPGTTLTKSALMFTSLGIQNATRYGYEASLVIPASFVDVYMYLYVLLNGTLTIVIVRFTLSGGKISLYNSLGLYTDIVSGLDFGSIVQSPYMLKVVCDIDNGLYVRLLFGSVEYDVSGVTLNQAVSSDYPYIKLAHSIIGDGVNPGNLIVSQAILTANEP